MTEARRKHEDEQSLVRVVLDPGYEATDVVRTPKRDIRVRYAGTAARGERMLLRPQIRDVRRDYGI